MRLSSSAFLFAAVLLSVFTVKAPYFPYLDPSEKYIETAFALIEEQKKAETKIHEGIDQQVEELRELENQIEEYKGKASLNPEEAAQFLLLLEKHEWLRGQSYFAVNKKTIRFYSKPEQKVLRKRKKELKKIKNLTYNDITLSKVLEKFDKNEKMETSKHFDTKLNKEPENIQKYIKNQRRNSSSSYMKSTISKRKKNKETRQNRLKRFNQKVDKHRELEKQIEIECINKHPFNPIECGDCYFLHILHEDSKDNLLPPFPLRLNTEQKKQIREMRNRVYNFKNLVEEHKCFSEIQKKEAEKRFRKRINEKRELHWCLVERHRSHRYELRELRKNRSK